MTDMHQRETHDQGALRPPAPRPKRSLLGRAEQWVCGLFCGPDDDAGLLAPRSSATDLTLLPSRSAASNDGLRADHLCKTYSDGTRAAVDVSLHAEPGEIVAVLGPNGAGKSTVLNMIAGLITPTSGTSHAGGVDSRQTAQVAHKIGVALQSSGLDPAMTGAEHMQVQCALYGVSGQVARACSYQLLDLFGLVPYQGRRVANYSIGLQRRLSLALAMVHDPPIVVLDEPTAGLDPQTRRLTWLLMQQLSGQGKTIVFSTQILEEADLLADRVYVIANGEIIEQGTPNHLREQHGQRTVRMRPRVGRDELAEWARQEFGDRLDVAVGPDHVSAITRTESTDLDSIVSTVCQRTDLIAEFTVGTPSLEDAFVELIGDAVHEEPLQGEVQNRGIGCRCS